VTVSSREGQRRHLHDDNCSAFAVNKYYVKEQKSVRNVSTERGQFANVITGRLEIIINTCETVSFPHVSRARQGHRTLIIDKVSSLLDFEANFHIPIKFKTISAGRCKKI